MREKIPKAESASKQQFKKIVADREIEVTCQTTGTGKSTANDESYDDLAATTE